MCDLKFSDVFKPGTFPEHTYITRYTAGTRYTYEQRLKQCLDIEGFLTLIVGPSKVGKTILCDKVIRTENIVSLSGNDFRISDDFWTVIAKKIGMSMSGEVTEHTGSQSTTLSESTTFTQYYLGNKDKVVSFFKENDKTLVLDDFHYAPKDIQFNIAYQLKDVIRYGFKAIVISLPHRADDTVRLNPDLVGRVNLIEIQPWTSDELRQIAVLGFKQLSINITDELIDRIATESINSPQLMQAVCLNIGYEIESGANKVTTNNIEASCRFTCINYPYANVVNMLKGGPPSRGQQRVKYNLVNGESKDIYGIILEILALDPPLTSLEYDDIRTRIDRIINNTGTIPNNQKVKDALKNLQKLLEPQSSFYQVFEWKDNIIYILDPIFLFYLRWAIGLH